MSANFAALLYLVSGALFIMALRGLSSPATSRQVAEPAAPAQPLRPARRAPAGDLAGGHG